MRDGEGWERLPELAADVVADADRDLVELVEHVQLRQRDRVEAVEHGRGAEDGEVEPAGAARAAGDRTELVAARAEVLAVRVVELRRKRAAADARRVSLGHDDHAMHVLRCHYQSREDAARQVVRYTYALRQ